MKPLEHIHENESLRLHHQIGRIKLLRKANHIFQIKNARRLVRRVHSQLRKADIHRWNGHLAAQDIAQGGASRHIRPVKKGLAGNARLPAQLF